MSNWSELPYDLLVEIVAHIKKLEHFVAFGLVCKGWCAASKKKYFKGLWVRQEIPYLMLPVRDDSDDARELYSLIEGEIAASVSSPNFKERKCYESLGWLLAVEKDGSMCLLHPFSSIVIPIPHQKTFPDYEDYEMDEYIFVRKFVLSARPSETSDFIVMIICGGFGHLAFWRPGDESWNRINILRDGGPYWDVMYHGGHFYAIDFCRNVRVITIEGDNLPVSRTITKLVIDKVHNLHAKHIEDSVWNDILYIVKTSHSLFVISRTSTWWSHEDDRLYSTTCKLRVYEVDMSTCTWTEINNIGSMAIFVGHNSTFAIDTCKLYGKIKSNHIYFSDDCWECFDTDKGCGKDMGAYNLETGTIESFYSGEVLESIVCPSIWITPSF